MATTSCEIKQGSRLPPLSATLYISRTPVDLTEATKVELIIRPKSGSPGTEAVRTCSVTDAEAGVVAYEWLTEDTAVVGKYSLEFVVTFGDGRALKCPSKGYATLAVTPDLNSDD